MQRLHGILRLSWCVLAGACGPGPGGDTDPTTDSPATTTTSTTSSASDTDPTTGPVITGTDTTSPATSTSTTGASDTADSSTTEDSTTAGPDGLPLCGFADLPIRGLAGQAFVAGDFDGDGAVDLAVKPDGGNAQLRINTGSGVAFTAGDVHDISNGGKMATGDFDGDGRLDLLHYDFSIAEQIQLQLNLGAELGAPQSIPLDALFYTLRVADVDGDGDSDVSFGGRHSDPVRVLLADAGTLTEAHQLPVSACYATGSDWADFDGDGDLDFAVIGDCNAVLGTPPIAVHLREGDGYVALPDVGQADAGDPSVLAAGDFDGDGVIDIVTQGFHQMPHFDRHRGLGDAAFDAREAFDVPVDRWVREALDVDADGLTDLLADGDGAVVLYRSTGPGFEPCFVGAGDLVAAADFDGDGRTDVIVKDGQTFTLAQAQ
ncbi:FG-GAP repeat domain-containing protein [Nannocystis pusilla]|uniref:VCBS repeat-containing protein n=1 Tax=Nannocystis pusilla TaxID=889268 RepID=A0ABS7TUI7_9BACT|nr:VCBS repeat-containing protein [Nannocystis pusilla]MBZ5711890.1 VCBS repeat-containing protein [Nannocystis pusilla]